MRFHCQCGHEIRPLIRVSSKSFPITCPECGTRQYLLRSWTSAWFRFLAVFGIFIAAAAFLFGGGRYAGIVTLLLLAPLPLLFLAESILETPEFEEPDARKRRLLRRDLGILLTVLLVAVIGWLVL